MPRHGYRPTLPSRASTKASAAIAKLRTQGHAGPKTTVRKVGLPVKARSRGRK